MWGSSSTIRILGFISAFLVGYSGETQDKATAAAFAGTVDDVTGMGAGDLPGEREAEAAALDAAAQRIVRAVEGLKNLALFGGTLVLFVTGAGRFSVDRMLSKKD